MSCLGRLGRIFSAERSGVDYAPHTTNQEFQRPNAHVRRYLLEAARKDPRYLPILPTLFTVAEADTIPPRTASVVTTFHDLPNVGDEYPPNLKEFYSRAILVDPNGIAPFLPYVHSDLSRIIDKDFEPEQQASSVLDIKGHARQSRCGDDDFELYWDFKRVTFGGIFTAIVTAIVTAVLSVVFVCVLLPYIDVE